MSILLTICFLWSILTDGEAGIYITGRTDSAFQGRDDSISTVILPGGSTGTLGHTGYIRSWKIFAPGDSIPSEVSFQVWRPLSPYSVDSTFTFIGENTFKIEGEGERVFYVNDTQQIDVQAGDKIGLLNLGDNSNPIPYRTLDGSQCNITDTLRVSVIPAGLGALSFGSVVSITPVSTGGSDCRLYAFSAEVVEIDPSCTQLHIRSVNQEYTLQSNGYPYEYENNQADCWVIRISRECGSSHGYQSKLTIDDMSIEPHLVCFYDRLDIFDGGTTQDPLLARLCGNQVPDIDGDIVSSQNVLHVTLRTDDSIMDKGFKITYEAILGEGNSGYFCKDEPRTSLSKISLALIIICGIGALFVLCCLTTLIIAKFCYKSPVDPTGGNGNFTNLGNLHPNPNHPRGRLYNVGNTPTEPSRPPPYEDHFRVMDMANPASAPK